MSIDFVISINDAKPEAVPATASFPDTVEEEWRDLQLSGLDTQGRFSPNLGCFLVGWHGKLVLCDAGIGQGPNAYLGGLTGHLPDMLAEMSISRDQIDLVIFSHLHMDHIGWATSLSAEGKRIPTFPRARYIVARDEFEFWESGAGSVRPHHREAFDTIFRPLSTSKSLELIGFNLPILPGISLLSTPGHTPGHSAIIFHNDSTSFVVAGDVFHCPGQVEKPDWHHRADMAPEAARSTRKRFIERAARENWLIGAGHFRDQLQLGRITAKGDGFCFVPEPQNLQAVH